MALPDYLQDTAKDFAKQLTATTSVPINTGTFTGRQFVAGEDPMQTQAINLAHTRCWILSTIFNSSTRCCNNTSRIDWTTSISTIHVTVSTTSY